VIDSLKSWWQTKTGEEETPFDGDAPAWIISMLVHMIGLLLVALLTIQKPEENQGITLTPPVEEEEIIEELVLPEKFVASDVPSEMVGAAGMAGAELAMSVAPVIADISQIPNPELDDGDIEIAFDHDIEIATGLNFTDSVAVKGSVGVGTTGAVGAVDRITQEILASLEERPTLVVWMFDQSGSLLPQRQAIHDRFDRIYEELGIIEAANNPAFAKHEDKPLLSSVMAFGKTVTIRTPKPTDDVEAVKAAVKGIEQDDSGVELVFSSCIHAAQKYAPYRQIDPVSLEPKRNVMLIAFTDERGDDMRELMEQTIEVCNSKGMPVYVVGVPAQFGREVSLVKWIDPNPEYDQTPQWGEVNQGPESFRPERLNLTFSMFDENEEPLDSGFGPFALTRLCYATGGIYFAVHPNRRVNGYVDKNEIDAFSADMRYFFDPAVMRRYRPDYVTPGQYDGGVLRVNAARLALVKAATATWGEAIQRIEKPRLKFMRKADGSLSKQFHEAEKAMNGLTPLVYQVAGILLEGEAERENEMKPRWQAGYDLALGQALAAKTRTDVYNELLRLAKSGVLFKDPKNNTFELTTSNYLTENPEIVAQAKKARAYLQRVIEEHPDTPWAFIAQRELEEPWGWEWNEYFTDLTPRPRVHHGGGGGGGDGHGRGVDVNRPKVDRPPPPPKRRPPKL